jgi:hypothetical protein
METKSLRRPKHSTTEVVQPEEEEEEEENGLFIKELENSVNLNLSNVSESTNFKPCH